MCVVGFTAVHYFTYVSCNYHLINKTNNYFHFLFSYEHPFLLADNRHYPFYLWKNIFRYHCAVKYVLVPVHCACMLVMGRLLGKCVCVCVCVCVCALILSLFSAAEAQSGLWWAPPLHLTRSHSHTHTHMHTPLTAAGSSYISHAVWSLWFLKPCWSFATISYLTCCSAFILLVRPYWG